MKSYSEIFKIGSTYARHALKRKIIKENLIPYTCAKCKNPGEWMGEKLVLQLEHKNGIFNDNRLRNLQFLCGNCHSQTASYAGRNSIRAPRIKNTFDYRSSKRKADAVKWTLLKKDRSIKFGTRGWTGRMATKINISPQKVYRWLMRVDPEFYASLRT